MDICVIMYPISYICKTLGTTLNVGIVITINYGTCIEVCYIVILFCEQKEKRKFTNTANVRFMCGYGRVRHSCVNAMEIDLFHRSDITRNALRYTSFCLVIS